MPRFLVKTEGKYFEWSTIVDAPVSPPLSLEDFKLYYRDRYGSEGFENLPKMLERVEIRGSSSRIESFEDIVSCNRFGPNETQMSIEDIKAWARNFKSET